MTDKMVDDSIVELDDETQTQKMKEIIDVMNSIIDIEIDSKKVPINIPNYNNKIQTIMNLLNPHFTIWAKTLIDEYYNDDRYKMLDVSTVNMQYYIDYNIIYPIIVKTLFLDDDINITENEIMLNSIIKEMYENIDVIEYYWNEHEIDIPVDNKNIPTEMTDYNEKLEVLYQNLKPYFTNWANEMIEVYVNDDEFTDLYHREGDWVREFMDYDIIYIHIHNVFQLTN
jgi:hypothetical protein